MEITITATDWEIFLCALVLIGIPWLCLWLYFGWRLAARHDERQERARFEPKEWRKRLTEWRRLQHKP